MSSEESDFEDFDEDDEGPIVSAGNPELARRMESMRQEMQEIQQRAEQADALAKRALDLVNEKDDRIDELEAENEELRERIEELEDSNSILAEVNDKRAMTPEDRAIACIQILATDAGSGGKASMTAKDGWNALDREYDRTRMYDVFRTAESLVSNKDICWFQKESRSSNKTSRLIVDRTGDDLPEKANGKRLRRGGR